MTSLLEKRLNEGENLGDIMEILRARGNLAIRPISIFTPNEIEVERAEGFMPGIIKVLKEEVDSGITRKSIVVRNVVITPFANYAPAEQAQLYRDVAELALREFYKWGWGIELSEKPVLLVRLEKPLFKGEHEINLKMPRIVIPGNDNELVQSVGDDSAMNMLGIFGYFYRFNVTVNGERYSVQKEAVQNGEVKLQSRKGSKKEAYIFLSSLSAIDLLESVANEHLHYMLCDITSSHIQSDPREKNPALIRLSLNPKDILKMVIEYKRIKKKDPRSCLAKVQDDWTSIEEGLVHAVSLEWMKYMNGKYNLGITEERFQNMLRGYNRRLDDIVFDYSSVEVFHRLLSERSVREVFQAYVESPKEVYQACYPQSEIYGR